MKTIRIGKSDTIPTMDGYIKIKRYNGSGLYWCDRYEIDGDGNETIKNQPEKVQGLSLT